MAFAVVVVLVVGVGVSAAATTRYADDDRTDDAVCGR
jgi:hypothetical protein